MLTVISKVLDHSSTRTKKPLIREMMFRKRKNHLREIQPSMVMESQRRNCRRPKISHGRNPESLLNVSILAVIVVGAIVRV
jgi:hypothetical protein